MYPFYNILDYPGDGDSNFSATLHLLRKYAFDALLRLDNLQFESTNTPEDA